MGKATAGTLSLILHHVRKFDSYLVCTGLQVSRIDPKVETKRYIDKIMAAKSPGLDAQEQALLLEDFRSPCTEEVAEISAFSRIVSEGRSAFVVLDTAPTGYSILLMDATGAYHRQMMQEFEGHGVGRFGQALVRTPLADSSTDRLLVLSKLVDATQIVVPTEV